LLGPFDLTRAVRVTDEACYSGRLVRDRSGQWFILAFRNLDANGVFIGEITDPMPVTWVTDGTSLVIEHAGGASQHG
jgi:beta-fructofuranosidase